MDREQVALSKSSGATIMIGGTVVGETRRMVVDHGLNLIMVRGVAENCGNIRRFGNG